MKWEQASRTAQYMAFFRALESVRREDRRIVSDPFAQSFTRKGLRRAVQLSQFRPIGAMVSWYADQRLPGARTSAIARTRLIDDILAAHLEENPHQVVILGAGYDCRAYRLPVPNTTTIFEVDHPSTQAAKLEQLRTMIPRIPDNVRFAGIDFNRESLPEVLLRAGFSPLLPTVFLWEGVSHYLTEEAVDGVLGYVAGCGAGSSLIFTYVHSGLVDRSMKFDGGERILRDVASLDEPWTFGLRPETLRDYLARRGLDLESDGGAREYRYRYYGRAAVRMKGYDFYHVAAARVAGGCSDRLGQD
ncbi:MAG: SAM-dependent methyltransferase [Acidobacteriaceae bacterium]